MSKEQLKKIYFKALNKVKAPALIKENVKINGNTLTVVDNDYLLTDNTKLYVFGVGKAALDMAKECELVLQNKISGGVVVSSSKGSLTYVEHYTSTHPLVSEKSVEAADKLLKGMQKMKEQDVFIFLLSGGASAMIEKPIVGLTLQDFTKISASLLTSGIDIKALNIVRKSISQIKGGKLANAVKTKGEVLVLSDVIGDDIATIGSAPMYNYKFDHHIIGNNKIALDTAKGYITPEVEITDIVTTDLECSSEEALETIYQKIKEYDKKHKSFCLLYGGETTTVVKGKGGYGGRNQELALRLLVTDCITSNISILCAGSDGIDGRSDATGAFVDNAIYDKIKEQQLDPQTYLEQSDSNTFFRLLDYDFVTGITGTNVMDFVIVLKK